MHRYFNVTALRVTHGVSLMRPDSKTLISCCLHCFPLLLLPWPLKRSLHAQDKFVLIFTHRARDKSRNLLNELLPASSEIKAFNLRCL